VDLIDDHPADVGEPVGGGGVTEQEAETFRGRQEEIGGLVLLVAATMAGRVAGAVGDGPPPAETWPSAGQIRQVRVEVITQGLERGEVKAPNAPGGGLPA
jgi:hypothetical protein